MIRVVLPAHLRTLARIEGEVALEVPEPGRERHPRQRALPARRPAPPDDLARHTRGVRLREALAHRPRRAAANKRERL